MKAVSFFSDEIKIIAHMQPMPNISASLYQSGSLQTASLYTMHNGDLMLIRNDAQRTFIEGPETV